MAQAVHSSKAVGEPPFFLATSVFFAIKEAIYAARCVWLHFRFASSVLTLTPSPWLPCLFGWVCVLCVWRGMCVCGGVCPTFSADAGITGFFNLDAPATAERIRMACVDDITVRHLGGVEAAAAHRPDGSY